MTAPAAPALPAEMVRPHAGFLDSLNRHYGLMVSPAHYLRLCLDAPQAPIRGLVTAQRVRVTLLISGVQVTCLYCPERGHLLHVYAPDSYAPPPRNKAGKQDFYSAGKGKRRKIKTPKAARTPKYPENY